MIWKNRIMRIQGSSKQEACKPLLTNKYRWRFTFKPRTIKNWKGKTMEVLKSSFRVNKTGSWIDFLDRIYSKKLYWGALKQNRRKLILLQAHFVPGPQSRVLSNTWEWVVQEIHVLAKQETLLGRGALEESRRVRKSWRISLPCGSHFQAYDDGISLGLISGRHSDSASFLAVHASLSQDGFHWGGFWEVNRTFGLKSPVSFWPFPNSSDWQ